MRVNKTIPLLVMMSLASTVSAKPDQTDVCTAALTRTSGFNWEGSAAGGYDQSAPEMWQEASISVRVAKGNCSLSLVIDAHGKHLSGPGTPLNFQLSSTTHGADISNGPSDPATTPLTAFVSGNDSVEFPLYMSISPNQTVKAGSYHTIVPVRLYDMSSGTPILMDETGVDISTIVGPSLLVESNDFTNGATSVDLGDLSSGFLYETTLSVSSNASVSVNLESQNNGRLKHEMSDYGLEYTTTFRGERLNLSAGADQLWLDLPVGKREDINLRLESSTGGAVLAGNYADTITVVFRAE